VESASNTAMPTTIYGSGFVFWIITNTVGITYRSAAAYKTVFTQRLKQSGMTWKLEGGQWIVDLRVVQLSGIWLQVYKSYLEVTMLPETGTQAGFRRTKPRNVT
jgi:hypothetical protein